jgi:hypothetical protein
MLRGRTSWIGSLVVASLLLAGCGGGSGDGSSSGRSDTTGAGGDRTSEAKPASRLDLAKPLYLGCETAPYAKAGVEEIPPANGKGRGWRVSYDPRPGTAPKVAMNLLIVEQSPHIPRPRIEEGHDVTIHGHRVSLAKAKDANSVYVAGWRTKTAGYTLIAHVPRPQVDNLIRCLP